MYLENTFYDHLTPTYDRVKLLNEEMIATPEKIKVQYFKNPFWYNGAYVTFKKTFSVDAQFFENSSEHSKFAEALEYAYNSGKMLETITTNDELNIFQNRNFRYMIESFNSVARFGFDFYVHGFIEFEELDAYKEQLTVFKLNYPEKVH